MPVCPSAPAGSCPRPSKMTLPDPLVRVTAHALDARSRRRVQRVLPEETPVAMVYDGTSHAVMMATPADIEDFALGFTLTEGIVEHPGQIASCEVVSHDQGIEARMWLSEDRAGMLGVRRRTLAGPVGCGLCGIDSLDQANRSLPDLSATNPAFAAAQIADATGNLRAWQPLHDQSRAVHAAGFLLPGQGIVLAREDVGRHNALDKLIGAMARQGLSAGQGAFVLTSRVSIEMVQKCAMAGCAVLIAASAPTAHALRLAEGAGITLAAFARREGFELFTCPQRLTCEVDDVA